jgi:hypothetical protein
MRSFFLILLFILGLFFNSQAIIGIGYGYKNVLFWRFWEIKDGQPVPEILVYNTGDTAIAFTLRKIFVVDMVIDSSHRKWYEDESARYAKDTIIKTVVIPPASFEVFVISNGFTDYQWDGAFINGKYAGIATHKMSEPDKAVMGKYDYRYYSYEGLYATPFFGLICKKELFTRRGETEKLMVFCGERFFDGINEMSLEINDGVDAAFINFQQNSYSLNSSNRKARFAVNKSTPKPYTMNISVKAASNEASPGLDMHTYFQNGSQGIGLPVFVQ